MKIISVAILVLICLGMGEGQRHGDAPGKNIASRTPTTQDLGAPPEEVVHNLLGDVLLHEDGVVVAAKRQDKQLDRIEVLILSRKEGNDCPTSFRTDLNGPYGVPAVRYTGTTGTRTTSWIDLNSDGIFDQRVILDQREGEQSVEIPIDGQWVRRLRLTRDGDATSPVVTKMGVYRFDLERGQWVKVEDEKGNTER